MPARRTRHVCFNDLSDPEPVPRDTDYASLIESDLLEAHVWPTLEIIISEAPGTLQRHIDPETGLALLALEVKG